MSNLFVALFLTTVTGSIFYLMGIVFRKIWFRKDTRLLRFQMEATVWAYLVPFVYIIMVIRINIRMWTAGGGYDLFYGTLWLRRLFIVLGCIWMILFLILLARKLYVRWTWTETFKGNIPEENPETEALFQRICKELGIEGKVSLRRNDLVDMPCLAYTHGFVVVMPLKCYTRQETAVILYHELCHYLNGDFYLKSVGGCIVSLLHVFNPVARQMLKQLSLVCEEDCDRIACEKGIGMFSRKEYFLTILNALNEDSRRERYNLFLLADTITDYERRVRCMSENRMHGSFRKATAVLLAASFLAGSSMTAFAVGDGVTKAYEVAADASMIATEAVSNAEVEVMSDQELLEEIAEAYNLNPEDIIIMGDEDIEMIGNVIAIKWDIPAGKTGMSTGFDKTAGVDTISVTVTGTPSDVTYRAGIKEPDDNLRYIEGKGWMAHEFKVNKTGRHCFFVTNPSSTDIHVEGTVY